MYLKYRLKYCDPKPCSQQCANCSTECTSTSEMWVLHVEPELGARVQIAVCLARCFVVVVVKHQVAICLACCFVVGVDKHQVTTFSQNVSLNETKAIQMMMNEEIGTNSE